MSGFDTDLLGTFTRETARGGSQLDAARRKARKGMELSGLDAGLASEGSFGPDPFAEMVPWNVELIAWLDDRMGIEVVGMAQGPARSEHLLSDDWCAVEAFAQRESPRKAVGDAPLEETLGDSRPEIKNVRPKPRSYSH